MTRPASYRTGPQRRAELIEAGEGPAPARPLYADLPRPADRWRSCCVCLRGAELVVGREPDDRAYCMPHWCEYVLRAGQ